MKEDEKSRGLTLHQAFEQLSSQPMWWVGILRDSMAATHVKRNYKNGRLAEKTMRKILHEAGYVVVQQELWNKESY